MAQARLAEMKAERDAALQSLLEVAQMRTSPALQLPERDTEQDTEQRQQDEEDERGGGIIGSSGGDADRYDRNSDTRWSVYPDFVAAHRNSEESRIKELTQVPDDEGSEGPIEEAGIDDSSSSRVGMPGGTPPITPGGTAVELAAGWRRANDEGVWSGVGGHSSSGTGEHICCVCGAPAPSFRKLFECRLSLGRAREEAAKASVREVLKEEGASEIRKVNYIQYTRLDYMPRFLNFDTTQNTHGPLPRLIYPGPIHDPQNLRAPTANLP